MNRLALFDCDGTLVDSQYSIVASMQRAFSEAGLPLPEAAAVRAIVGLRLDEAIRRLLPSRSADAIAGLCDSYRRAYVAVHKDPDQPERIAGRAEALQPAEPVRYAEDSRGWSGQTGSFHRQGSGGGSWCRGRNLRCHWRYQL